jgi:hypothetical protein
LFLVLVVSYREGDDGESKLNVEDGACEQDHILATSNGL